MVYKRQHTEIRLVYIIEMADQVNNSGGTPKHSRFRKSTVPLAKDHLRRGNTESALFGVNVISRANEMSGSGNLGSGKVEPVLPNSLRLREMALLPLG